MPYVNFNVARVRNNNDFKQDSFRTIKGGEHMFPKAGLVVVPDEIRVISGQLKQVENEQYRAPMELLFPIDKYPAESDVRTWLEDENIEMINYYPAGEGKIDDEEDRALEDIDLTPTDAMINEAKKGLEWRKEFNRGGTDIGVGTAEVIINKSITLDRVKRMYSYFSRHEVDKKAEGFEYGEDGFPSNGRIAWALWGGDAGFEWSQRKTEQIKDEEERNIYLVMGCSCSGKSTYIRNNAKSGDLIFDFDKIHQALTISEKHQHNDIIKKYVFEIRDAIFNKLKRDNNIKAWIINSSPLKDVRKKLVNQLNAKVIYIQRDKDDCLKIAENERPEEYKNYINNYFNDFDGFDDDENIEIIQINKKNITTQEKTNKRDIIGYLITDGIELPLFETIEEAEEEAEKLGGSGYHEHKVDDVIYFMPFESHAEAMNVLKENNISEEKKIKEYNNFKINNMERRIFANEFRVVDDKKKKNKKIIGYASVFYNEEKRSESENLGGFYERINPRAFDKVIEEKQDVRALFNHNADLGVLGRTTSGTLKLEVDEKGLKYEIDTPDTQLARDLVASMERGDISQSSFGFTISENGDSWDEDSDGRTIRTINQVEQLFDISPVVYPAYTDASVALRSFDNYKENKQKTENTKEKTDLHERNLRELKLKIIK